MQANQRKIDLEKLLKHRSKVREAQALDLRDGFDDFDMFTGPPVFLFPLLSDIKYGPPIFSLLMNIVPGPPIYPCFFIRILFNVVVNLDGRLVEMTSFFLDIP